MDYAEIAFVIDNRLLKCYSTDIWLYTFKGLFQTVYFCLKLLQTDVFNPDHEYKEAFEVAINMMSASFILEKARQWEKTRRIF